MRRFVALVSCAVSLASAAAVALGAPLAEAVTLRVDVRFDRGTMTREIRFDGRVSTGAAGEVVDVQAKECGRNRFYRLIAGTRTLSGGSWALDNETGGVDMFNIPPNAYFRARWKGTYSNVVLVRVRSRCVQTGIRAVAWRESPSRLQAPATAFGDAPSSFSATRAVDNGSPCGARA